MAFTAESWRARDAAESLGYAVERLINQIISPNINCNLMNNVRIFPPCNLFTKQSRFAGLVAA